MRMPLPKLVVVLGPTASGKSGLGISLAQRFDGEIVSADSRQVYTVAQFQRDAIAAINDILEREHQPFLVGGSPHYIQAVVDNLDIPRIEPQPELRAQLENHPLPELLTQLEQLDPQSAATIDRNNPRRVIRALEVNLISGKPFSQQRNMAKPLYRSLLLGIEWPREVLYRRIDARVDERMRQGMVHEVQKLLDEEVSHERLEALGLEYRYISRLLRGEFRDEDEMVERLKYAIHDFTRRQLTWYRKDKRIVWIEGEDGGRAKEIVRTFLLEKVSED